MTGQGSVLLVFLDGVGIGLDDPDVNPFVHAYARGLVPTLQSLTGGRPPTSANPRHRDAHSAVFPLDARMDVAGTPQSGTGQAALLTGENAAEIFGRHFGPWTPVLLRPLVEEQSILRRAQRAGRSVSFANAYPKGWPGPRGGRRLAGPPLAARGASALNLHEEALGAGSAVSSEIVNDGWQEQLGHAWLPTIGAETAGHNLAGIANRHDLTLYAHYTTDTVGHLESMKPAVEALRLVDDFLGGLLEGLDGETTLLIASDHGNIEDVNDGHTLNPVLGVAHGPGADAASSLSDIRDLAPFILGLLRSN